jgi:TetR/AcrR family transcriptional regulator, fatty acid biosynthesis regulator
MPSRTAVHRGTVHPVASRAEQKARTRKALVGSVLRIVGDGANFASISLREVAKTAGVVPTSFYRHFEDMDELGLAVVDQLGLDIRRLLRGSLDPSMSRDEVVDRFVTGYQAYVLDNADLVRFANQARTGGTAPLNQAIGHELEYVGTRLASGLSDVVPGLKPADRDTAAALILAVLLEGLGELLSLSEDDEARRLECKEHLIAQLSIVLLGADQLAGGTTRRAKATKTSARTTSKKAPR